MKQSRNFVPKFVSSIAALSLCLSSAVAHHPDTKWEISGSNSNNHSGSGSGSSSTTTISNLESGGITTKSDANGTISSLVIEQETNNNNNPTLEVGNGSNNSIVNVPKITIEAGATLNRTIQNNPQDKNKWNILFRGGSTIESFENTGTIKGGDYGIFIEGGTIKNLKNSGTIEGKKDGIAFFNAGGPLHTTITNLEIEQGIVKGGENGINLSRIEFDRRNNNEKNERIVENLIIGENAIVEGANGSGLVLGKVENKRNGSTNGQNNGQNDTYQLTGTIQVNGTLKGTKAGITNYRDMGTEGGI